ncbi:hypothetical protein LQ327_20095 [Actinomycetospora endophytica]|uniref:Uncharacterized protein n=1 Tax=Actinomycetospora endophytica TaxID=2291215 RepID=A0ABS8PBQ1_9PSEU|nr:hypothetical protein [Actinomycetospora endophytica]MCD2195676.1 hypothetical protein [Actinomycetospora endophytica]
MLIDSMHQLAGTDPVLAAGILAKIGKAIFAVFAGVFIIGALVGVLIGFFVGRTVGRKQSQHHEGAGSDAEQLTG